MNWLVYLGLKKYNHHPGNEGGHGSTGLSVRGYLPRRAVVQNHRVAGNSKQRDQDRVRGGNAIPFYHWGALTALVPLLGTGAV